MNAKTNDKADDSTAAVAPSVDVRAAALANNRAAAVEADIRALSPERQRDILHDAAMAYLKRHEANPAMAEDPAWNDLAKAVATVTIAKG